MTAVTAHPMNVEVAARLSEAADLLEHQDANPFRVQAYRNAATTVLELPRNVLSLLHEEGLEGLERLPGIGTALARAISLIVTTGRLPMLDRLRGEADPLAILATVPGVGRRLAERIHDELDIDSSRHWRWRRTTVALPLCRGSAGSEWRGSGMPSPLAWAAEGRLQPSARLTSARVSGSCSMWTGSIAAPRPQAVCAGLRRAASIPGAARGSR